MSPELFFPSRGDNPRPAQEICAGCRVSAECLAYGLREKFGVWGGRNERQRRQLQRRRQVA